MSDERFSPILKSYIAPLFTVIGILGVAYFGYKEVERTTGQADTVGLYKRIGDLESKLDEKTALVREGDKLAAEAMLVQQKNAMQLQRLTDLVDQKVNHREYMQSFIDNFPLPMIIKDVADDGDGDHVTFPTKLINDAYSRRFNISKYRYKGKTTSFVWDEVTAELSRKRNLQTYKERGALLTVDCYPNTPGSHIEVCTPVARAYGEYSDGNPAVFTIILDGYRLDEGTADLSCDTADPSD